MRTVKKNEKGPRNNIQNEKNGTMDRRPILKSLRKSYVPLYGDILENLEFQTFIRKTYHV